MTAAADEVDITAIMNPCNGPGNSLDANYVAAVNAFRAAGGRVIGYVYSSYGSRPLAQVTADIDKYDSLVRHRRHLRRRDGKHRPRRAAQLLQGHLQSRERHRRPLGSDGQSRHAHDRSNISPGPPPIG